MGFWGLLFLIFVIWCISKLPSASGSDTERSGDSNKDNSQQAEFEDSEFVMTYDGRPGIVVREEDDWAVIQLLEDTPGFIEKSGDIIYQRKEAVYKLNNK